MTTNWGKLSPITCLRMNKTCTSTSSILKHEISLHNWEKSFTAPMSLNYYFAGLIIFQVHALVVNKHNKKINIPLSAGFCSAPRRVPFNSTDCEVNIAWGKSLRQHWNLTKKLHKKLNFGFTRVRARVKVSVSWWSLVLTAAFEMFHCQNNLGLIQLHAF